MSPTQPPRRFVPEPVETTARSSAAKTARRHAPEPIETSVKRSKDRELFTPKDHPTEENCDNVFRPPEPRKPRKFAVTPVETSHVSSKEKDGPAKENKPRRFAPEPVETSQTSNKDRVKDGEEKKKPRKFAVEPVETSHASSKEKAQKPRTRFAPQLIEASEKTSNRRDDSRTDSAQSSGTSSARKFAPQLIETAKRSRKAGHDGPAVLHTDRTDAFRNQRHKPKRTMSDPIENSPYGAPKNMSAEIAECRRLGKPLPKRQSSTDSTRSRSHSFYVPDLDPIESSESDRSDDDRDSSMSTSPSAGSDVSKKQFEHATRARESVDGHSSGYLLELAARAAEKHMRDQALDAFPNDDRHYRVDHYVDKAEEDTYMSDAWSVAEGGSTDGRYLKVNWEIREMQKHAKERLAAEEKKELRKEAWRTFNKKTSVGGPWGDAAAKLYSAAGQDKKEMIGGWQEKVGLAQMRKGARPPMLGSDIKFPRCPSPEPARFDVTQGSEAIRQKMCYLSGQSEKQDDKPKITLWGTDKTSEDKDKDDAALWSKEEETPPPEKGLWGGFCTGTGATPPRGPTGLMTPFVNPEDAEAMESLKSGSHQLPPSPPASNSGMSGLDEKLQLEQAIEEEFDDAFVTQVYNYLSLGYPSMARKFDAELAKISRIELTELRADDAIAGAGARGYIRLGEENGIPAVDEDGNEVKEEHCARWRALRMYVREWARQQPSWQTNQYGGGVTVRRGSWAW